MAKGLSHRQWVLRQFNQYGLRKSYRNVILHASIIEGVVRNESGKKKFGWANDSLKKSQKITRAEYDAFEEVRDKRNELIHEIFKNCLNQNQVDDVLDDLMKKILKSYKISGFLNERLFKGYGISRLPSIAYNP